MVTETANAQALMLIEEREWGRDKIDLYKATVCKGASDLELAYLLATARRTGLDPGTRQIYSVPYGSARAIQIGIDGYRLIADRTKEYVGSDAPVYTPDDGPLPNLCTVTVHRLKDGVPRAFSATIRYSEFKRATEVWKSMPWHMCGISAERHALRKAFPQELAGIEDEIPIPAESGAEVHTARMVAMTEPRPAPPQELINHHQINEVRKHEADGFDLKAVLDSLARDRLEDLTREEATNLITYARTWTRTRARQSELVTS